MVQVLVDAKNEILELRRQNELLQAQTSVVEVFAAALGLRRNGECMKPDVAWMLQREIDKLNSEDKRPE